MTGTSRHLTLRDFFDQEIERMRAAMGQGSRDPYSLLFETTSWLPVPQEGLPSDLFARATISRILERSEPILATLNADGTEKSPGLLEPELVKLHATGDDSPQSFDYVQSILPRLFLRPYRSALEAQCEIRLSRAIAAVFFYRHKNGSWPDSLKTAGFSEEDFFNRGFPFGYRRERGGFRVWSIGADRVDQGGLSRFEVSKAQTEANQHDLVFAYPQVPPPTRVF